MTSFILSGIVLGFSAGISPGPLLTLVISETVKKNAAAGILVAASPLITDAPIIAAAYYFSSIFKDSSYFISFISILGGAYLLHLGVSSFKTMDVRKSGEKDLGSSLKKGTIANFLNPSPYIFWITVGIPILSESHKNSMESALCFILFFYVLLVGTKVILAFFCSKFRNYLNSTVYTIVMKATGVLLICYAFLFFKEGFSGIF